MAQQLKAMDIIRLYDIRWNIEVFFKDAKQLLGLRRYQNRSYKAAVIHLHLVCFAYALDDKHLINAGYGLYSRNMHFDDVKLHFDAVKLHSFHVKLHFSDVNLHFSSMYQKDQR